MQKVSKSLDLSLSSFIAGSIKEYLHQVTSEKGTQTVELEVPRFAYGIEGKKALKNKHSAER
jgi:hypothetical protein